VEAAEIARRYFFLKGLRQSNIEQTWDEIEQYISPIRSGKFYQEQYSEAEIQQRRPEVWDLTAIWGAQVLSSSMLSSLVSPATRWFRLAFRDPELEKDKDAKVWVDDVASIMFDSIQESNFNTECASAFQDLVAFGNSGMTLETESETEWKGLDFSCPPIRELYFEQDHKGNCSRLFRRLQWTPYQIISKWGQDAYNTIPDGIKSRAESASADDNKITIIFCVYRRQINGRDVPLAKVGETLAPDLRPWGSKYVVVTGPGTTGSSAENGEIGEEGGYYEMPAFITRWEKTSGSMWGHGPGAIAIPTVKYLNAWMQTEKAAAEKVVDPAILTTERGLLSDLDLTPGGLTTVRSIEDIKPFENHANFVVSQNTITELRGMINKVFRVDDLQLKESPAMTATEVQVRYELMNRILGSTVTRIQTDFLNPLINRVFRMMMRAGQLPRVPQVVIRADPNLDIQYQGPLMRAQRSDEVAGIERITALATNMLEAWPEVRDVFDPTHAVREVAERLGVPATVLNSEEQARKLKQQREQAQQTAMQQQQAELQQTKADAAGRAAAAAATFKEAQSTAPNPLGGNVQ
jgi:transposase-like protein